MRISLFFILIRISRNWLNNFYWLRWLFFVKVVSENAKADPRMLIHEMEIVVESHVLGHIQSDDITMMTISYNG